MSFNALAALEEAGHRLDLLSERQRSVFAGLREDEVDLLNSIKRRLDAVGRDEVEAQDVKVF